MSADHWHESHGWGWSPKHWAFPTIIDSWLNITRWAVNFLLCGLFWWFWGWWWHWHDDHAHH